MPKIIENLRETLLAASRTLLLEEGYRALTMRQVAGLCHVAVGTVYNYFPSKDMLAAHILLEDWNDLLRSLQKKVNAAPAPMDGLEAVFPACVLSPGGTALYGRNMTAAPPCLSGSGMAG